MARGYNRRPHCTLHHIAHYTLHSSVPVPLSHVSSRWYLEYSSRFCEDNLPEGDPSRTPRAWRPLHVHFVGNASFTTARQSKRDPFERHGNSTGGGKSSRRSLFQDAVRWGWHSASSWAPFRAAKYFGARGNSDIWNFSGCRCRLFFSNLGEWQCGCQGPLESCRQQVPFDTDGGIRIRSKTIVGSNLYWVYAHIWTCFKRFKPSPILWYEKLCS